MRHKLDLVIHLIWEEFFSSESYIVFLLQNLQSYWQTMVQKMAVIPVFFWSCVNYSITSLNNSCELHSISWFRTKSYHL